MERRLRFRMESILRWRAFPVVHTEESARAVIEKSNGKFLGIQRGSEFVGDVALFAVSGMPHGACIGVRLDELNECNVLLAAASACQRYGRNHAR
jgi:hypothetical protein